MSDLDDGWERVTTVPANDEWEQVPASERPAPVVGESLPEASPGIPEAFLHRIATGLMIGGSDPSPEVLRAKGWEDFNLASKTVGAFKAGLERMRSGFQDTHSSLDLGVGAFQALTAPLSSVFQAVGGAGEKATGGILSGDQINMALMVAGEGSAPGTFARVRGGMEQAIGTLPTAQDFTNASKVMEGPRAEANLKQLWQEQGIHPAEAVHDASQDGFFAHEIKTGEELKPDPETEKLLFESGGGHPGSLSAAITDPADLSPAIQPPAPAGSLIAKAQDAAEKLFDIGRDIQMKLTPMARGSMESMATVKDYMNSMRRNEWDSARVDTDLTKRFNAEDRARMANAMEEESLSLRLGEGPEAREHQGLATLTPEERATVIDLDNRQQLAWMRAQDLGMVEGDGIAMHFPRMVTGIPKGLDKSGEGSVSLTATGFDLRTSSPYLKQRKYMELEETEKAVKDKLGLQMAKQGKGVDEINAALANVKVARDIRAVNIATKQLEDAVAGRSLIKNIQDVGRRTGEEAVAEGFKPDDSWFTVDHPAFKTWRPKFQEVDGKVETVKDAEGKPVFEQVPIYVRGDFEGPLRAVMWGKSGAPYKFLMALKGKTMSMTMNSPAIHGLVELGRAFPTMPIRIFKAIWEGKRAKRDIGLMHEAIDAGLVPIGKRFFNQEISTVMESPDLTAGRSWTAKLVSAALTSERLLPQTEAMRASSQADALAIKSFIDKAGDFWHNTLLWDQIANLQMGLYTNFRSDLIASGRDQRTASVVAAHLANRYAGALPREAMSEAATKFSNLVLFSRSFTFGNLGVMKDAFGDIPAAILNPLLRAGGLPEVKGAGGLPRDVMAQLERDGAAMHPDAASYAKSIARRKAIATVILDTALFYIGNSIFQSAMNVILGGRTISQEEHAYWQRAQDLINDAKVHPLSLLNPFHVMQSLSATRDNEPGRQNRVLVGYAKDGTAIYARNPTGKIGEEFLGYFDSPLDMMRKKESTAFRPMMQILDNDAGFGRKVYDQNAEGMSGMIGNIGLIVEHMLKSQLPMGQINAVHDLVTGEGDRKVNLLQAFGPFAGLTFSRGAPGGPAVGEMYHNKSIVEFRQQQALPDIRRQILRGDMMGARRAMTDIGMDAGYQNWIVKTTQNPATRLSPRALSNFYRTASPEQKDRMMRLQQAPQGRAIPYSGPNLGPLQ